MKKTALFLTILILSCSVFRLLRLPGTQAIIDLSSAAVGIIYLSLSLSFFRKKDFRVLNILSGLVLVLAACFAILPLLFYFLNSLTFVININYNDILFNYYKYLLNSLIGLQLFFAVCICDAILQLRTGTAEKRKLRLLIQICSTLSVIVFIFLLRNLGCHISFCRILMKVTLLSLVLLLIPYLLYARMTKQLLFIPLLVTVFCLLTGIQPAYLFSSDFSGTSWFAYTLPVHKHTGAGIDTLRVIQSFKKEGPNFYSITFRGDYTAILEQNNKNCVEESIVPKRMCSLFTSFGDTSHYLFARNFDNPAGWKCKTLLCKAYPIDGYASLSLVRLADIGYDVSDDLENFPDEKKKRLVNAVFYVPDGINEKGLVVALAAVENRQLKGDSGKAFINCSYLIRELLDHAKDVNEAIAIIRSYNIMNDVWSGSFDQHLLIADASGRSVIAEIGNGAFQFIPNESNWQATTNSPSWQVPINKQKKTCERFGAIASQMERTKGRINTEETFALLKTIGHSYTEWSAVYDISQRELNLVLDYDFSKRYNFSLRERDPHK